MQPAIHANGVSSRAAALTSFYVMEVLAEAERLAQAGRDVVRMEVGEPDRPLPAPVAAALADAAHASDSHYTPSTGEAALRTSIARQYAPVSVSPDQVLVSAGASPLLWLTLFVLTEPGDEVLLADPGYPCYLNVVRALGLTPRSLATNPEAGFALTAKTVRAAVTPRTRVALLGSPANPTGTRLSREALTALAETIPWVVVDEVYRGLEFVAPAPSALARDAGNVVVVDSCSKRYAMPGFRVGWGVFPRALAQAVERAQQNLLISANTDAQRAALAALNDPDHDAGIQAYAASLQARRDAVLDALTQASIDVPVVPDGAFYLLLDLRFLQRPSLELAHTVLHEAGVALAPGIDFGRQTEGYLRLSFARPRAVLTEGVARLGAWLAKQRNRR